MRPGGVAGDESLRAELDALGSAYAAALPARLREVERALADLSREGWDAQGAHPAHALAHRLAGSGATYGFPGVSAAARGLEDHLRDAARPGARPDGAQCERAAKLLGELWRALPPPRGE